MSKLNDTKKIILEILSDGMKHSIDEFYRVAIEKKLVYDTKDTTVRNAIYQLKKNNSQIQNLKKGEYRLVIKENEQKNFENSVLELLKQVESLRKFNWINCSDEELEKARTKITSLQGLSNEIQSLLQGR